MTRLTFKYLQNLAEKNGYNVERKGKEYLLWSNEKMKGTTVEGTLTEIYSELFYLIKDEKAAVVA